MLDSPPDPTVEQAGRLIEGTDPDAAGATATIGRPETEAFLGAYRPTKQPRPVRYVMYFCSWLAIHNGLTGTKAGTLLTPTAEVPDAELNGRIGNQRQVSKDLAQTDPGAELLGNQDADSGKLAQPGINCQGNTARSVVAGRYSFIA